MKFFDNYCTVCVSVHLWLVFFLPYFCLQGVHPCDKRRSKTEYETLFPAIDFSLASNFSCLRFYIWESTTYCIHLYDPSTAPDLCVLFSHMQNIWTSDWKRRGRIVERGFKRDGWRTRQKRNEIPELVSFAHDFKLVYYCTLLYLTFFNFCYIYD